MKRCQKFRSRGLTHLPLASESHRCEAWTVIFYIAFTSGHAAAGLLFLFRVWAVYRQQPWFSRFMALAWIFHITATIMLVRNFKFVLNVPAHRCIATIHDGNMSGLWVLIQTIYELLVCGSVTYKLGRLDNLGQSQAPPSLFWHQFFRRPVSTFTARFMQDGQVYFV